MSYNGSGTFQINTSGQPVVAGTVISSTAFNALTADLATGLSTAITKDGQTATTVRIPFAQGISSTLVTDSSSVSTGSIITAGGVGIAKALYVGTDANIAGTLNVTGSVTLTNPVINNIKMGYSTTATAAGTTTLTVASNYRQFFTGSTTQTIVLPVTSTLVAGMAYEIENNSTGLLTVNSSGGNLVGTVPAGVCAHAVCIGTTLTTAADWDWDYISTTTITGTGANVLATSPTLTTPALGTPSALVLTNATGLPAAQLTGTQTLPKATLPTGSVLQVATANFSYSNTVSTTSQMNFGSTPTISQGAQIGSITFTPVSSTSTLIFSFGGTYNISAASNLVTAIFEGSTCIGAIAPRYPTTGECGFTQLMQLSKASNGAQTYTVRMGPQNPATASFLSSPAYTVTQSLYTIMEISA